MADMVDIDAYLAKYPPDVRPLVGELLENALEQVRTLERERADMPNQRLTLEYDNGGGQSGTRENPWFRAYNALMSNYRKTVEQLLAAARQHGVYVDDEADPIAEIIRKVQGEARKRGDAEATAQAAEILAEGARPRRAGRVNVPTANNEVI